MICIVSLTNSMADLSVLNLYLWNKHKYLVSEFTFVNYLHSKMGDLFFQGSKCMSILTCVRCSGHVWVRRNALICLLIKIFACLDNMTPFQLFGVSRILCSIDHPLTIVCTLFLLTFKPQKHTNKGKNTFD